ncbi:hypothetical protein LIER_39640 [Lithospermum erythrorhizon]|uniref:Uncharacterized protein n=1 Tax=Lithospermum erythrorhizon TaxID=34254 RepID=A0AAV3QIS1_LITER
MDGLCGITKKNGLPAKVSEAEEVQGIRMSQLVKVKMSRRGPDTPSMTSWIPWKRVKTDCTETLRGSATRYIDTKGRNNHSIPALSDF